MVESFGFAIFGSLLLVSAIGILLTRDIIRTIVWLLAALGASAGLFFGLGAYFLGTVQLILYAGGTLVLTSFGVMLTRGGGRETLPIARREWWFAACASAVLALALLTTAGARVAGGSGGAAAFAPARVNDIGHALLSTYLLPFEVLSVLLLAVMIGAAHMAGVRRGAEHA